MWRIPQKYTDVSDIGGWTQGPLKALGQRNPYIILRGSPPGLPSKKTWIRSFKYVYKSREQLNQMHFFLNILIEEEKKIKNIIKTFKRHEM